MTAPAPASHAAKPFAILAMQLLLVPVFGLAVLLTVAPLGRDADAYQILVGLTLVVWTATLIIKIALRRPAARWLGGAFICAFMCAIVQLLLTEGRFTPGHARFQPNWLTGAIVLLFLLGWWLHLFVCSPRVKRYLGLA